MRPFPPLMLLATSLLLTTGQAMAQTRELSSAGELLDGVAAVVNDGIVLKSELQEELEQIVTRLRAQGTALPPQQVLTRQVLERLVIQQIQLQRAERNGIQVPDEMLNQALANVAERNGVTLDELPAALATEGIDYNAYRRQLRDQITIEQLRQRDVVGRIAVSPKEIDVWLARESARPSQRMEYRLSHILVALSATATPDDIAAAQARIEDIRRRALAGEDFAELAVAYSAGQQALEGGDLGWRKGPELPSLFADVVPTLNKGEVSAPIRSSSGFHLVRLTDSRGGEPVMENQTHVRHILVTTNEILDDAAVRQKLADIRQRVLDGDDFAAIARVTSEDPQSAINGGDLDWNGPGRFVPAFEAAMNALAPGEISEPVQTPFGWHLIQVLDRRVHDTTADRQRFAAINAIRNSRLGEETELWTRRLRDEAFVELRL